MIRPNWDVFRAKFSGNTQYSFEWLCYLLFCIEHKQPYGIFRFKNQSAIETNPIEVDTNLIGFQAKFYDTTLSSHKDDLLEMLEKSHRDYPDLYELIVYTNQEWAQNFSSGQAEKPAGLKEIEDRACDLGITIRWRGESYFESPFVASDCESISKYFFSDSYSIQNLVKNQEARTESILKSIKDEIKYGDSRISINRVEVSEAIEDDSNRITIICGKGGIGKTVEVKKYYAKVHTTTPIFAFKASEFDVKNINALFPEGEADDFLSFFADSDSKAIVIDSAEKLLDIRDRETLENFIALAVEYNWRLIFTTRESYFDDLNYLCQEILEIVPYKLYIPDLSDVELNTLSLEYAFSLPVDQRLKKLIKTPFYLSAFLRFYNENTDGILNYSDFKEFLWNKKIKDGDVKREQLFIKLAQERANKGKFYLPIETSDSDAADALTKDEILGINNGLFFISHDIYEEWALNKIIDNAFKNRGSVEDFFTNIGSALPIRRSFRFWISEKLRSGERELHQFIDTVLENNDIASIWQDEILVAILLSDYSKSFFENFKERLVDQDDNLLEKISFILRIACKDIDEALMSLLSKADTENAYSLCFTKPKGSGWSEYIGFIYDNRESIGIEKLNKIIPNLYEWNNSVKDGDTTRKAGFLCLEYYKWIEASDGYLSDNDFSDKLIKCILYGADEIQEELSTVLAEICSTEINSRRFPYSRLSKAILNDMDGLYLIKALPSQTLLLAKHLWFQSAPEQHGYGSLREHEHVFGITDDYDFRYSPESAYKTPVLYLLRYNFKETLSFIIDFINTATQNLVSYFGEDKFHKATVSVDGESNEIYLSNQLWGAYRGAGNAPDLIKSMLMALEKFLLENANHFGENLGPWLKYILKKTNSTALCGVVSSVVLANKESLFDVASHLCQVKEFIQFDLQRMVFDSQHKSQLTTIGNMFGGMQHDKMHHVERLASCDLEHRRNSLETMFLHYQIFAENGLTEEDFHQRQQCLWDMFDDYYEELEGLDDSEDVKLWRLCLARMDRRRMDISTENHGDKIAINFEPELSPDLEAMSKASQDKQNYNFRYQNLQMWATYKLDGNDDYLKYEHYENSPQKAFEDLKELVAIFQDSETEPAEDFILFNINIPSMASSVLISHHHADLSEEDIAFCTDLVFEHLNQIFRPDYRFQVGDGTKYCFQVLPTIFELLPDLRFTIKPILLVGLLKDDPIDMWGSQSFSTFSILAIQALWDKFADDAEILLKAFLLIYPKYTVLITTIREESYKRQEYSVSFDKLWERLFDENSDIFDMLESNAFPDDLSEVVSSLDIRAKSRALYLIPNGPNSFCKALFINILNDSAELLLKVDRDNKVDYKVRHDFFRKFAFYTLQAPKEDISPLIQPFVDAFTSSDSSGELLEEIVSAQDQLAAYENFWMIWEILKPKVVHLSESGYLNYRHDKVIRAYLFVQTWKSGTKSWHTFTDKESRFFREMSAKLARSPSTLLAISKLLNDIGSSYFLDGVYWVASILKVNSNLTNRNIDTDSIFYMNAYIKRFVHLERPRIRQSPELTAEVLVILDFLIGQGEVSAYLLREEII